MDDNPETGFATSRRVFIAGFTALAAAAPLSGLSAADGAVVETTRGRVRGGMDRGVHVFRGVPYGAPTGGANRWRAPQPRASWSGVRDASIYASAAPQHTDQAFDDRPDAARPSEDCLVVNIWTPGPDPQARRPVMVWLHGGGTAVGSGQEYVNDGTNLAGKQDVVLVTVNHRLNAFGYLWFGDLAPAGSVDANVGQLDLVAALAWVHDNIAAFGGDPGNVTIFGQSGGGGKVSALLAMPAARGLFHKAILQSGFAITGGNKQAFRDVTARLFDAAGVARGDMEGLRALTTEQVQAAYWTASNGVPLRGSGIVTDGVVLPRNPFAADLSVPSPDVPLLLGHTAQETTVLFPPPAAFTVDWDGLPVLLGAGNSLGIYGATREPGPLIEGFRRLHPQASASDIYFAITTCGGMGRNARLVLDKRLAGATAPTYQYLMAWKTHVHEGKWQAAHGTELPMVFDTAQQRFGLIGDDRAEYQAMADVVSPMWAQFARTGNPGKPGLPEWPEYRRSERAAMVFDVHSAAVSDPLGAELALIERYY